jgi:hypothetical protein
MAQLPCTSERAVWMTSPKSGQGWNALHYPVCARVGYSRIIAAIVYPTFADRSRRPLRAPRVVYKMCGARKPERIGGPKGNQQIQQCGLAALRALKVEAAYSYPCVIWSR